ncbi:BrnT family toxin [Roseicyclus sp.]
MGREEIERQPDATRRGFAFDDVMPIFLDPDRLTLADTRRDYGEDRWVTFGEIEGRLFAVPFTVRGEVIRIIGQEGQHARKEALRWEPFDAHWSRARRGN